MLFFPNQQAAPLAPLIPGRSSVGAGLATTPQGLPALTLPADWAASSQGPAPAVSAGHHCCPRKEH